MKTLGEKLKLLRIKNGYLQKEIANKIGISITAYGKIEKNNTDPGISRIKQLCRFFDVSVGFMLDDEDNQLEQAKSEIKNLKEELSSRNEQIAVLQQKLIKILEEKINTA